VLAQVLAQLSQVDQVLAQVDQVLAQLAQLAQAQAQVDQAQLSLVPGPWFAYLGPCCSAATRQARTQAWRGPWPWCNAAWP